MKDEGESLQAGRKAQGRQKESTVPSRPEEIGCGPSKELIIDLKAVWSRC